LAKETLWCLFNCETDFGEIQAVKAIPTKAKQNRESDQETISRNCSDSTFPDLTLSITLDSSTTDTCRTDMQQ